MTLLVEKGTFTKTTSTSVPVDQTVTLSNGSLTPKLIILWTDGQTTNDGTYVDDARISYGFSDGTNDFCQALRSDESAESETYTFRDDGVIAIINLTANNLASFGELLSFGEGNFHINWTTQNDTTAQVIHYIVAGGTDIENVSVVSTTVGSTGTGNLSFNGSGTTFTPDFALCATGADGYTTVNALSSSNDQGLFCIGAAKSTTKRWVMWGRCETAATSDTDMYLSPSACLSSCNTGTGAITFLADFVSFNSAAGGGITVNVSDGADATTKRLAFLLVKGGQWDCDGFQQRSGTGTQDVTIATGLNPDIVFLAGVATTSSATVVTSAYLGIGASDGTNEGATYFGSTNALGTWADVNSNLNTKVYRMATPNATASSSTTNAECDMTGMSTAGQFTLDWTTADSNQRRMAYWVLGPGLERISKDSILKYNIIGRISLSRIYKHHIVGRISNSRIYKWNMDARVSLSRIYKWHLQARTSLSRIYKYNIIGRITKSSILKYNIIGRISKSLIAKWNLLMKVKSQSYSILLDGNNDYVNAGNHAGLWSQALSKFSFSFWVYYDNLDASNVTVSHGDHINLQSSSFGCYGNADITFRIIDSGSNLTNAESLGTAVIGSWMHVVCTYDSTLGSANMKIYVNGVLGDITGDETEAINRSANLLLGSDVSLETLAGNIKDFRFWDSIALTQSEVDKVRNRDGSAPTPDYWLPMEEGTGNPVDSISGSLTGSLQNGASWEQTSPNVWSILGKNLTLLYNIISRISLSRIYKYHIQARVSLSNIYKYNIQARVSLSRIYKYHITTAVSLARVYKYNIQIRVSLSRNYLYNVLGRISLSRIYKYHVVGRISLSRIYKWNIDARISLSRIYKWHIIGRISQSRIYKWNLQSRVSLSRIYKWNLLSRVSLARAYLWNIISRTSLSRVYKWDLQSRVSLSRIYKWNLIGRVSLARIYLWNIEAGLERISKAQIYKWNIQARVTLDRIYKYNIQSRVSLSRSYKYHILQRISLSRVYLYNLIGRVSLSRTYKYNLIGRISLLRTYKYNILNKVSLSRIYKWNITTLVSKSQIYKFNVLSRVSKSSIFKWTLGLIITTRDVPITGRTESRKEPSKPFDSWRSYFYRPNKALQKKRSRFTRG